MSSGSSYQHDEELLTALRELRDAVYEEPGYHTPKNIFNPAMTKSIERTSRSSILPFKTSPPPPADENPYSSLKKNHVPRWDIEALVSKETDQNRTFEETLRSSKAVVSLTRYFQSLDSCDYALGVALLITVVLFFTGILILFS